MPIRIPKLKLTKRICIICEGYEEYDYLEKLKSLNKWNNIYDFSLINVKGAGNIPARYQEKYSMDNYDVVLVFCDTDQTPNKDYDKIKEKIDDIHGVKDAAKSVIIFENPCTMQVMLMHYDEILLSSPKKSDNKKHIKRLTGVKQYKAKAKQRQDLYNNVTEENYETMKENVSNLSRIDTIINSSNFDIFMNFFEGENTSWIEDINKILESGV